MFLIEFLNTSVLIWFARIASVGDGQQQTAAAAEGECAAHGGVHDDASAKVVSDLRAAQQDPECDQHRVAGAAVHLLREEHRTGSWTTSGRCFYYRSFRLKLAWK